MPPTHNKKLFGNNTLGSWQWQKPKFLVRNTSLFCDQIQEEFGGLDLANQSIQIEPFVSHHGKTNDEQFTEQSDSVRPARNCQIRLFGPKTTIDPSLESIGDCSNIFPAIGGSNAWVLQWKTHSRPIGVRICPACSPNRFFSTAVDPRAAQWLYCG